MAEVFADNGTIIWIGDDGDSPRYPYWKAFMQVAVNTDSMGTSMQNEDFMVFFDKDDNILAIQMPDPVTDDGVPKEAIINELRGTVTEEEIGLIIESVTAAKKEMAL